MDRKAQGRMQFKEKVVQIYTAFFMGQDITGGRPQFWDEFFLLKVNIPKLNSFFDNLSVDELSCLKPHLNRLFAKCVEALRSPHPFRVANAAQTLHCLVLGLLGNKRHWNSSAAVLTHLMIGAECVDSVMEEFLTSAIRILSSPHLDTNLKLIILNLLLDIVCAYNNLSENLLAEYLLRDALFDTLTSLLSDMRQRQSLGQSVCFLLTLLMQYRKFEIPNPFRRRLSGLDDELVLNGLSHTMAKMLNENTQNFRRSGAQPKGLLSSLSTMIGSMFIDSSTEDPSQQLKVENALLLAMYESMTVNRLFASTLLYAHGLNPGSGPTSGPNSPTFSSAGGALLQEDPHTFQQGLGTTNSSPSGTSQLSSSRSGMRSVDSQGNNATTSNVTNNEERSFGDSNGTSQEPELPANLLLLFLEYASIVMQDLKAPHRLSSLRLCFVILLCMSEDQFLSTLIHDEHLNFQVKLHRMPMRHRKQIPEEQQHSRPLASAFLDLMVEFIQSHLMRAMPFELYFLSLSVVHRLLCYQKRASTRLTYDWNQLWSALFNTVRFVLSLEQELIKTFDIFQLATNIFNIFNVFVTYGDTFLHSPSAYDQLYYELIRMQTTVENVHLLALRYSTFENEHKESAQKLCESLQITRAIINHFAPKIDAWTNANGLSTLTEEQVLALVRSNYETLTLRLLDGLQTYERYSDTAGKEKAFFLNLLRGIVASLRNECAENELRLQKRMHEMTAIS